MTILGKKQMSEEDIKLNYITPVILDGWKGHVTMETKITDGRINIYKTVTSRLIRKNFSEQLKQYYWKPYFWSDSYFVCSVSDRTESAVKSYIDSQ